MSIRNLQYVSDIHLERKISYPKLVRKENNLALLGDIGDPFKDNYTDFLSYASDRWENVFLLAGNHEYWQAKYNYYDVNEKINDVVVKFDNVLFLNNTSSSLLPNYIILGTTLWSHILSFSSLSFSPSSSASLSSYNLKKPLMGDDLKINLVDKTFNELHFQSVNWLKSQIFDYKQKQENLKYKQKEIKGQNLNYKQANNKEKVKEKEEKQIVVLTHYLPSYKLIIEKYRYGFYSKYHDRFASDLDEIIQPPISYWLCGHSHCILETQINGIYCGINSFH